MNDDPHHSTRGDMQYFLRNIATYVKSLSTVSRVIFAACILMALVLIIAHFRYVFASLAFGISIWVIYRVVRELLNTEYMRQGRLRPILLITAASALLLWLGNSAFLIAVPTPSEQVVTHDASIVAKDNKEAVIEIASPPPSVEQQPARTTAPVAPKTSFGTDLPSDARLGSRDQCLRVYSSIGIKVLGTLECYGFTGTLNTSARIIGNGMRNRGFTLVDEDRYNHGTMTTIEQRWLNSTRSEIIFAVVLQVNNDFAGMAFFERP